MRTFDLSNEDSLIVKDNKIVANVGGQELVFDIEAVNKLVVYTTCMGPLSDDMGMIIHLSGDTTISIMSGHECYENFLFDGLGKALPIDHKKIIEASGCTEPEMFVIYKKDSYDFPFADGPHAVCMTCCHVLEEHNPIRFVFHDKDSWQFLCGEVHETVDARMVSLNEILYIDDNMKFFANLECGDYAEMDEETGEWMIAHDYYPEDEEYDEDEEDDEPSSEKAHRTASSCGSKLEITLEDGEVKVSGSLNLGYIGVFADEQIELDDTLEEIREWDIVTENLDEDCTDEEIIEFLNQYFNSFADRITQNIENINNTFLLYVFDDMINTEFDFREIDELYIEEKNFYSSEMDISEIYKVSGQALSPLAPYFETPNDGSVPKGHLEAVFRGCFPMFDLDCLIESIELECIGLSDGSISFQCSDGFDNVILCGAYAELDEDLSFSDWHNF
ncbi:MAG: hypothetical protein IKJ87_06610 [Ruminococcus sp.]|nr:hypothetical protein [Ruminococcus sp.]